MEAQAAEQDEMLWSLLRAHQQRAEFTRRMAEREKTRDRSGLAAQLHARSKEYEADAEVIQSILERRRVATTDNGTSKEEGNGEETAN